MALKTFRPTTPSLRQLVQVDRSHLWKGAPVKLLTEGKTKSGGRNNYGRITSRFRGGGHKQAYRTIDFKRTRREEPATVERIEYDPNRTAFIALVKYKDGGIIVLDALSLKDAKTKALRGHFEKLGFANALIIDGAEVELNFRNAARNIPNIDVLPVQGINVYDILRRKTLVLTKAAVEALEARFK